MIRFVLSFFGGIFTMLTLGAVLGALMLGGIFFFYGRSLPNYDWVAQYIPPTMSRAFSGEGVMMAEYFDQDEGRRLFTPITEIPAFVAHAFVSAEDKNYYTHTGFDARGILVAGFECIVAMGSGCRGASTITQQTVKLILLSGDVTPERKIQEIILANALDRELGKDRVMEIYLNEIFLGRNSSGITQAARTYFNKPLVELTLAEAAYLASLAQRPNAFDLVPDSGRSFDEEFEIALARRNYVLEEMFENGYIDEETMLAAQAEELRTVYTGDFASFRASIPEQDYFTAEIERQLTADFGGSGFDTAGLTIRATIDPELQEAATEALQRALEQFDRGTGIWRGTGETLDPEVLENEATWRAALRGVSVARDISLENPWSVAVVLGIEDQRLIMGIEGWRQGDPEPVVPREDIQWMRGDFFDNFEVGDVVHIRRMTADSDGSFIRWTLRQVPEVSGAFMAMDVNTGRVLAMQGGFSFGHTDFNRATQAQRQPGSAFKPFVYAAALDSGYSPATIVVDAPIEINTPQGIWRPQNASNRFYGPTPLRIGIEQSRNLMTIRLAQEVGMNTVARYAERFGVYDEMNPVLAGSLGSEETTLYRLVAAYAMFANGGERVEPTLIDRVQDVYGNTIYRHDQSVCVDCSIVALPAGELPTVDTNRERIMDPVTAYQLTSMMRGVVDRGTASGTINLPVPIAGKTGTTNDAKDVWFVGFSSNIVAGCYIGYDIPRSMGDAGGGTTCGPVFQAFMSEAIARYGGGEFTIPQDCAFIPMDRLTGARLPAGASGSNVVTECFREWAIPTFGITFDGGFEVAGDLPLFDEVRTTREVENATGGTATIGPRATVGTLSSGGLY